MIWLNTFGIGLEVEIIIIHGRILKLLVSILFPLYIELIHMNFISEQYNAFDVVMLLFYFHPSRYELFNLNLF